MKFLKSYVLRNKGLALMLIVFGVVSYSMMTGTNVFFQQLVDLIIAGDTSSFVRVVVYASVFMVCAGVMFFLAEVISEKFAATIGKDIRNDLYQAIMSRTKPDFAATDTAEYISAMSNDVNTFGSMLKMSLWIIRGGTGMVSALVIMLVYSLPLTLVAVGCSILAVVVPIAFTKPMQRRQLVATKNQADFTVNMKEIFSGHEVIASLGLHGIFKKRFSKQNDSFTDADYKLDVMRTATTATGQMLTFITRFIMVLVAGFMVMRGSITIGAFTLFVALQGTLGSNLTMIFQVIPFLGSMKPVADKLEVFINYENRDFSGSKQASLDKKIEISGLSFEYNENVPVLTNMSLSINKNEKLALTGPSGAGKTTLIKLLSGDYAGYTGKIVYDGTCLRDLDINKLRRLMTVIHQNTFIFNESIRYNICLGEEFSDVEMEKALRLSGVCKFIQSVHGGLDGDCGEKGVNLSGGQKQRIAIARALIRGAKFLVLDEGVSAVDVETANEIEQELLDMADLTLLTVTHRIKDGLLDNYDRVIACAA